jgi:hypothetical protein
MHNPPMIPGRRLFLVAVAALALGCGDATDDRPARWSFISATIMEPSCATVNCHSAVANRAAIDLHDRATGYNDLVGRSFVYPGDASVPGMSPLLYLLKGQGSLRMPPDGALPQADIDLIDKWIKAGAKND